MLAATDERARKLKELQFAYGEGTCVEASGRGRFRSGHPVTRADLPAMHSAWPVFTLRLEQLGFH